MANVTLRVPDEVWDDVKAAARRRSQSANQYVTDVLIAITDPSSAGDDRGRLRERLARAGLLEEPAATSVRPAAGEIDAARRRAGRGTPLSDLVAEGRR